MAMQCLRNQPNMPLPLNFDQDKDNETGMIFDPRLLNLQPNVPTQFLWPDHEKPSMSSPTLRIPLIDLAGFLSGDPLSASEASRLVADAGMRHGFFLVTNHGVDERLISRAHTCMDTFFTSPSCEKKRAQRKWGEMSGYASSFVGRFASKLPWKETLSFCYSSDKKTHSETVKDYIYGTMGDGYEEFGKVYQEYCEAMSDLSLKIMELLGMSLGIERSRFREFFEENDSILRLNYYPPCKQPDLVLGTGPHCDPTSLTILHQDQVGGLQVFVDGQWQCVPPNPRAFVVNIGDTLMALTNGKYKSCLHRAVVNSERERKSVAFFLCPKGDKVVEPPKEILVGDKTERAYPDFTWSMFLHFTQKHYRSDMNTLQEFTKWLQNRG
ncbi:PREDICTED: gibberellin 20 oxidase 3 [Tarenaya hassleriana]|uniref:gibberellin 20 oxidase 3 n=1 Tax=Tarenaya hassleriana TaxID=28532 RepID=UPI00053C454B|nr:PREDICTED: gibberellin 20 oxidase 3 [Tarenaya hassleriana]